MLLSSPELRRVGDGLILSEDWRSTADAADAGPSPRPLSEGALTSPRPLARGGSSGDSWLSEPVRDAAWRAAIPTLSAEPNSPPILSAPPKRAPSAPALAAAAAAAAAPAAAPAADATAAEPPPAAPDEAPSGGEGYGWAAASMGGGDTSAVELLNRYVMLHGAAALQGLAGAGASPALLAQLSSQAESLRQMEAANAWAQWGQMAPQMAPPMPQPQWAMAPQWPMQAPMVDPSLALAAQQQQMALAAQAQAMGAATWGGVGLAPMAQMSPGMAPPPTAAWPPADAADGAGGAPIAVLPPLPPGPGPPLPGAGPAAPAASAPPPHGFAPAAAPALGGGAAPAPVEAESPPGKAVPASEAVPQRLTPHRSPMKAGKAVTMSGMSGAVWSGWAAGAPPFAPSGNASAAPALPPELSRLWRDATPTKSAGRSPPG